MPRCIAQKDNGTQCKCNAIKGSSFCGTHSNWKNVFNTNIQNEHEIPKHMFKPRMSSHSPNFSTIGVDDVQYMKIW
jgi:hypothetical protein